MNLTNQKTQGNHRKMEWRSLLVMLYISLLTQARCENASNREITKSDTLALDSQCHNCFSSNKEVVKKDFVDDVIKVVSAIVEKNSVVNKTIDRLELDLENLIDEASRGDRFEIFDGIEIKARKDSKNEGKGRTDLEESKGRALFSKYTYEYRLFQKVKDFVSTHILSINLPKAAKYMGFRSFGINKFLLPLFIGGQLLIKTVLLAMFLPSILGSFGKMLGKGISHLSAASSQASYPPMNGDDQTAYNNDNKDAAGYETNPAGAYAYPDMYGTVDAGDANDLSNVDMSRFGAPGQYMPSKNSYYQGQMATTSNYKVFQKIPASSMILSNYDPFYSPLLSRLDGIFARLGLAPSENAIEGSMQVGGQMIADVKLEACREQLICLMYATPAKYAPYSNLVSAQLSRELNELRRPVSDNPEILRFFRYMRAARRGQEAADCMHVFPGCAANAAPAHTMIAAYHDINKLVTARKLGKT